MFIGYKIGCKVANDINVTYMGGWDFYLESICTKLEQGALLFNALPAIFWVSFLAVPGSSLSQRAASLNKKNIFTGFSC